MKSSCLCCVALVLSGFFRIVCADVSPVLLSWSRKDNQSIGFPLHKTHTELLHLGFQTVNPGDECGRLLGPERGSFAVLFADSFACVRLEKGDSEIEAVYKTQRSAKAFVGREAVYTICDGHCVAKFEKDGVGIISAKGESFHYGREVPLFLRKSVEKDWSGVIYMIAGVILCGKVIVGGHRKVFCMMLGALVFVALTRDSVVPRYRMVVEDFGHGKSVTMEGYTMDNFSQNVIRKGDGTCVIYMCNSFTSVQNLRTGTRCDVLSFRVERLVKKGREVRKNWLKVVVGIWILSNTEYQSAIYIDRDLILDEDPSTTASNPSRNVVFPDLGGGRPDSAMFLARGGEGLKFLQMWLDRESGVTTRRDGGEEQEALLDMHKKRAVHVKEKLYKFQCGRNALNRAECLQRRRVVDWNSDVVVTKLTIEAARWLFVQMFATKGWIVMPGAAVQKVVGGSFARAAIAVLPVIEVVAYQWWFQPEVKEVKCGLEGVKAISHGSFDNPFRGTLSALFQHGVASRTPFGWTCVPLGHFQHTWARWQIHQVTTFLLAQLIVLCVSAACGTTHLLSGADNARTLAKND